MVTCHSQRWEEGLSRGARVCVRAADAAFLSVQDTPSRSPATPLSEVLPAATSRAPGFRAAKKGQRAPRYHTAFLPGPTNLRRPECREIGEEDGEKATERLLSTPYLPSHTQNGPWWRARSAGKLLQRDANHQPHETADPAEHGRRVTVRILINLTLTYMATRSQWLPYWMAHFWTLY